MTHSRAMKFFGDLLPESVIYSPRHKAESYVDEELLEVIWDAFNGRGKRAAKTVSKSNVDEYLIPQTEDEYVDWDAEIEEALKAIRCGRSDRGIERYR